MPFLSSDRYVAPTINIKPVQSDLLQFHLDRLAAPALAEQPLHKRFLHPLDLNIKQVNYKIRVPEFAVMPPLALGQKYISDLTKIDLITPNDIYLGETNPQELALDNYHYDPMGNQGDFARFEQVFSLALPDKFFDEYNGAKTAFKMGMFAPLERVWLAVDNKLVLWNYRCPPLLFNHALQFMTVDLAHTILLVQVVTPRPGVFVEHIKHMLVIVTAVDIQLYLVDTRNQGLELYNPNLLVPVPGLVVTQVVQNKHTHDIFFCGDGDGVNVWRLDYSHKGLFTKLRCDKVCLTKLGLVLAVLPNKIWSEGPAVANSHEVVKLLQVDGGRLVVYTLSNKLTLRAYKLHGDSLTEVHKLTAAQIVKMVEGVYGSLAQVDTLREFALVDIVPVLLAELLIVQLIAITTSGCRILFKLGALGYFSSGGQRLLVVLVKFPPLKEQPHINPELDLFARLKQFLSQMIANQQKLKLLQGTHIATVISPGVFVAVKRTKRLDKLFVCTTNYGYLKKNNKWVEDAAFYPILTGDDTYVQCVVPLTPAMNATDTPQGYANVLATQYTKTPLKFAVVTNKGVRIFQYRPLEAVLHSLNEETVEYFIEENGYEETCNTLLYLACLLALDVARRRAGLLFALAGENARLQEPQAVSQLTTSQMHQLHVAPPAHPTADQVVLLDRFYGSCLLVLRIFRDIWFTLVFKPMAYIKTLSTGAVERSLIKLDNLVVQGLTITKQKLEFFIGLMVVLVDFFKGDGAALVQGLASPNYLLDPSQYELEICLRAEHLAFSLLLKLLELIREALLFLMVLLDADEGPAIQDLFKGLPVATQVNLLRLSFKDLLLPSREVKQLIKDLLLNVINKKIVAGGGLIDVITTSLKGKCELFCSTDDVLIFKAIENLTKARNIGLRDVELKEKCLHNAIYLFEQAFALVSYENVETAVDTMVDLEFYPGAVELLLKLIQKQLATPTAPLTALVPAAAPATDTKVPQLYLLVYKVLTQVDLRALKLTEAHDGVAGFIKNVRDPTYQLCFDYKDQRFQDAFYQWFIDQGVKERLLEVETPYILPFLTARADASLDMSNLLWLYHAKRQNYYDAAQVLYTLAISQFHLDLDQRIEYLSRANGFCNCACPPNQRPRMIQLALVVMELFDIATIQLDLVKFVDRDPRVLAENRKAARDALFTGRILPLLDLFNLYADPLGYYELCLVMFAALDYKNGDDILKRWELLVEKLFHKTLAKGTPFYLLVDQLFATWGLKLSDNDVVFPLDALTKLVARYVHQAVEEHGAAQQPPEGFLANLFLSLGVLYDKIYFALRTIIETDAAFDLYPGFTTYLQQKEMGYLIKKWFANDKKIRDLVGPDESALQFKEYSLSTDPIQKFIKSS